MVARISSGTSPTGAVYYNEEKVGKGEAERLAVRNYEGVNQAVQDLRLGVIAGRLEDQAAGNDLVRKPTFHASLSLAQGENPTATELVAMADRYMAGMGYAKQPYVIYQHHDTDHTHIHIVSVRVDDNGKKIPDNYERERSNKIRQSIEKEFGLQVAEKTALRPERILLQPVEYGKGDLKRELSAVVNGVLKDFTFSSFSQFNQLLSIYNVKATEVAMEGKKPGLLYSVMDSQKVSQGAPYRSSSLPLQPTMDTVNRRMNAGKKIKGDRVKGVRKVAAEQLSQSTNWDQFQQKLSKIGVEVIPHMGKDNNLFGISFIDVQRRGIYTGSELGKEFTAGSLKTALGDYQAPTQRVAPEDKTQSREVLTKQAPPQREQAINQLQTKNEDREPMHNIDLVRQLLYALGQDVNLDENERGLKTMLKRSRKPRLS
ncbi:relaxase/mobilization nuclease domain-containing protein [Spirosoma aerophilum]